MSCLPLADRAMKKYFWSLLQPRIASIVLISVLVVSRIILFLAPDPPYSQTPRYANYALKYAFATEHHISVYQLNKTQARPNDTAGSKCGHDRISTSCARSFSSSPSPSYNSNFETRPPRRDAG